MLQQAKKAMKMVESSIRIFTWLSAEGERSEAEAAEAKQAEKKVLLCPCLLLPRDCNAVLVGMYLQAPPSLPFKLQRVRENVEALTVSRSRVCCC